MPDHLRLEIDHDDDGTAELFAHVEANGFSGHGSAWFDTREVAGLSAQPAQAFPLQTPVEIKGGYWIRSEPVLKHEHLALKFYPAGGRGVVGCQVRIASVLAADERPERQQVLHAELLTSYQQLQEFAVALGRLAANEASAALLRAVEL